MMHMNQEILRPVVVGAYAAIPSDQKNQEMFYDLLACHGKATALEIPFRDGFVDPIEWLARQMRGRFTRSVITLIPGTMERVGASGVFGLASPDEDARHAAMDYVRAARQCAEALNQLTGEKSVEVIHVHPAPSMKADAAQLGRSLEMLVSEQPNNSECSTRLVLEHCDAYDPKIKGEKRFLSLDDEIPIARSLGMGVTINWGRSAVEAQNADRPLEHVRQLVSEGMLEGLMFSGAGRDTNDYGAPWADAHLPLTGDEPTSLMDETAVEQCLEAAGGACTYTGAKVQVPTGSSIQRRVDMIRNVTRSLRT